MKREGADMNFTTKLLIILVIACSVDYQTTVSSAEYNFRLKDLQEIVGNLLENGTVLNALLDRFPEFFKAVTLVVNQTASHNLTTAIDEAYICRLAESAIHHSKDTCYLSPNMISNSCFVEQNITEITNASVSTLCENINGTTRSMSASSTRKRHSRMIADSTLASSITTLNGTMIRTGASGEVVTGSVNATRYESRDIAKSFSTKEPNTATNSSTTTLPITFPTHVATTVLTVDDKQPTAIAPIPPYVGNRPTVPPLPVNNIASSYLFLAMKLTVKTAMISFERKCHQHNGIYVNERRICIVSNKEDPNSTRNYTIFSEPNPNGAGSKSLLILNIVGNSCSIVAILLLVVQYFICKNQFLIFDKSILSLAFCLQISHLMQLFITFFSWNKTYCKAGGIVLHWALLTSFAWISIISFDIFKTFRRTQLADSRSKKKYFIYLITAMSASTMVVVVCIFLGIPANDYSGYGHEGRCFIGKVWANLFSFVLPVAFSLMLNTVLMITTLLKIYKSQKRGAKALAGNRSRSSNSRKNVVVSILTLKLSVLFGLGWFLGFIASVSNSPILAFIFTGIVSLQGLLVFVCFGCHKLCLKKLHERSLRKVHSPMLQTKVKSSNETETTHL